MYRREAYNCTGFFPSYVDTNSLKERSCFLSIIPLSTPKYLVSALERYHLLYKKTEENPADIRAFRNKNSPQISCEASVFLTVKMKVGIGETMGSSIILGYSAKMFHLI